LPLRIMTKNLFILFCIFLFSACADFSQIFQGGPAPHPVSSKGTYYVVQEGDTLDSIAEQYDVPSQTLAELNDIRDETSLEPGRRLFIPRKKSIARKDERVDKRVAPVETETTATTTKTSASTEQDIRFETSRFIWPVNGIVTSPFGVRHGRQHDGIDIAAPRGSVVKAAAKGKVVYAGRLAGYGNLIIVKHLDNFFTAYAHLSKYEVSKGERVDQGKVIGLVGMTGKSTGPHCHFEIRQKTEARNPLFFLPKK